MNGQKWSLKGSGMATLIAAVVVAALGSGGSCAFADEGEKAAATHSRVLAGDL